MSKELVFKSVFWSSLSILGVSFAMLLYVSYQDYVNPKHVLVNGLKSVHRITKPKCCVLMNKVSIAMID